MRPIPPQMLRHKIELIIPEEVDVYHHTENKVIPVRRVCLQKESKTGKTSGNTTVQYNALLFVDRQLSGPRLDWFDLKRKADEVGGDLVVVDEDLQQYTVTDVQPILDDRAAIHHYEVGLI